MKPWKCNYILTNISHYLLVVLLTRPIYLPIYFQLVDSIFIKNIVKTPLCKEEFQHFNREEYKTKADYQKNRPILFAPSKINMPVGVSPRAYSQPSLPYKQAQDQ